MEENFHTGFCFLANVIMKQFTPSSGFCAIFIFSKVHTVEIRHDDARVCFRTQWKHCWIVCHMLHCAQVYHRNSFKLKIIHPSCSCLIWAFTLSLLSLNIWLLISVFSFWETGHHISWWWMLTRCDSCQHALNYALNAAANGVFPLMFLWMSDWRAAVNHLKWKYVYKHHLTMPDEYSVLSSPGRKSPSAISQTIADNYATSKARIQHSELSDAPSF